MADEPGAGVPFESLKLASRRCGLGFCWGGTGCCPGADPVVDAGAGCVLGGAAVAGAAPGAGVDGAEGLGLFCDFVLFAEPWGLPLAVEGGPRGTLAL